MSQVLYVLGIVAMAAGFGLVGFGIPINEFSLGNTLIIAGTTAAVGGAVVVGLAAVHAQLRRLAEIQALRPPARMARPPETAEPAQAPAAAPRPATPGPRAPFPQRPRPESREPRSADSRSHESREPRASAREWHEDAPSERPRSGMGPVFHHDLEPSVAEPGEDAPLSPRGPSRPVTPASQAEDLSFDPKGWSSSANRGAAHAGSARSSSVSQAPRPSRSDRLPASERERPPSGVFDSVWPRAGSSRSAANSVREAEPSAKPDSEPTPMAILKSGVVDGMAYTLYTDGSIEAELAQGTMRFNSIEELRTHLEKSS